MHPEVSDGRLSREIAMLHIAVQLSTGIDSDLLINDLVQRIPPPIWRIADLPPEVGTTALDASAMEMVDAMYSLLTRDEETAP